MRGKPTSIKLHGWHRRNMWQLPSGEAAVRPGLRRVLNEATRRYVDAWTERLGSTAAVRHYIVSVAASGTLDCRINVYDESWVEQQSFEWGADVRPSKVTRAVVDEQILITAPELPAVWGYVSGSGGGLQLAVKKNSVNPGTTALDIPQGICTTWVNRAVIAAGPLLYFSDGSDFTVGNFIRTFTPQNLLQMPAPIYGLHVGAGGALIICTAAGTFALPEQAGAAGQIVIGDRPMLSDYRAPHYRSTCEAFGRVWGLTSDGLRVVDTDGADGMELDEPVMPTVERARIATADYKSLGTLSVWPHGPIVTSTAQEAACMLDQETKTRSWWTMTHEKEDTEVVGFLEDQDGDPMLVTTKGVYVLRGNFDGEVALTENGDEVVGGWLGRIQTRPADSPKLRYVLFGSDGQGDVKVSVRGEQDTKSVRPYAVLLGTTLWASSGTPVYEEPELDQRQFGFSVRSKDLTMELFAEKPLSRVSETVDVVFRSRGRRRSN